MVGAPDLDPGDLWSRPDAGYHRATERPFPRTFVTFVSLDAIVIMNSYHTLRSCPTRLDIVAPLDPAMNMETLLPPSNP